MILQRKKVWDGKFTWVIDYVCNVSKEFVFVLETTLSLDEMIIQFFGRSLETHCVKNPSERYTSFCTSY